MRNQTVIPGITEVMMADPLVLVIPPTNEKVDAQNSHFQNLSAEILILIFEDAWSNNDQPEPAWFQSLRYLTRRLYQVLAAFRYRKITLTNRLLRPQRGLQIDIPTENIRALCKHIVIDRPLPWDEAILFISQCPHIQDLTASNWGESNLSHMPRALSTLISSRAFRLHIPHLPFGVSLGDLAQYHVESFPASSLISLTAIQINPQWNHAGGRAFNIVLVKCKNLDSLTLVDTDLRFLRHGRGKLPPVRRLRLLNCEGEFAMRYFGWIWDFSKLEELSIGSEYFFRFLGNDLGAKVAGLKKLEIWQGMGRSPGLISKGTSDVAGVLERVLSKSPELERLEIGGCDIQDIQSLAMAAIARLTGLRVLKLRDFAEQLEAERSRRRSTGCVCPKGRTYSPSRNSDKNQFPSISLANLEMIQQSCSLITELDLGIDREQKNYTEYLNTLAKFRDLRVLTLRTQTISDDFGSNIFDTGEDLESAKEAMSFLESRHVSGMLLSFTMIVLPRLLHPEPTKWKQKSLITRRFVLRKGDDLQVVNQELPVIRPEISANLQHFLSHDVNEENVAWHSSVGGDEAGHEASLEGETLETLFSNETRERTNSFSISDDRHMQREAGVRTGTLLR